MGLNPNTIYLDCFWLVQSYMAISIIFFILIFAWYILNLFMMATINLQPMA